jgi:hypothetical protein
MKKIIHWLRAHSATLLVAIIGLCGAYYGAYNGAATQTDLWRREKLYQNQYDILNKRIEIAGGFVRAQANADRMSMIMKLIDIQQQTLLLRMTYCDGPQKMKEFESVCAQELKGIVDTYSVSKEIADLQAQFFINAQLAVIYFCDKTREVMLELQNQTKTKPWWELDRSMRQKVVEALMTEMRCNLGFDSILK